MQMSVVNEREPERAEQDAEGEGVGEKRGVVVYAEARVRKLAGG